MREAEKGPGLGEDCGEGNGGGPLCFGLVSNIASPGLETGLGISNGSMSSDAGVVSFTMRGEDCASEAVWGSFPWVGNSDCSEPGLAPELEDGRNLGGRRCFMPHLLLRSRSGGGRRIAASNGVHQGRFGAPLGQHLLIRAINGNFGRFDFILIVDDGRLIGQDKLIVIMKILSLATMGNASRLLDDHIALGGNVIYFSFFDEENRHFLALHLEVIANDQDIPAKGRRMVNLIDPQFIRSNNRASGRRRCRIGILGWQMIGPESERQKKEKMNAGFHGWTGLGGGVGARLVLA